ncbi:hypothetical protein F1880_003332 [Penicillium rolfsii]|nr:hypothetical protein F1880_003332 [Penicillium rolfsii]
MGQTVTKEPPTEFLPPVQTREELQERFKWRLSRFFMSDAQTEWLQTIFNIFCTESDSAKFWTQTDLKNFMISTFPSALASSVAEAAPILHRCLLRLGSFPYHNDPEHTLSLDVLRTAIIILLGLDGRKLLDQDNDEASIVYPDRLSKEQRILLFQSMAERKGNPDSSRGPDDDYHLQKALDLITYGNFKRNHRFPTAVTEGPEYPAVEHFPSSNSTLTSGSIMAEDFRPLLRLMLLTQLYVAGIDPDQFTSSLSEIEAATDCLLAAFIDGGESSVAVSFAAFDNNFSKSMQNAFLGLPRVLGPLHSAKAFPSTTPPSSVTEAQEVLKELFTPTVKTLPPPKGLITSLPVLSQLSMSLPQDFPIEAAGTLYSSSEVDVKRLKFCLSASRKAKILLVSGKTGQEAARFGAYFPKDSSPAVPSVLVQLSPVHRKFHGFKEPEANEKIQFTDSLHLELALSDVTLVLRGESATANLIAQFNDGISREIAVDAVEVLSFEGSLVCVDTFK